MNKTELIAALATRTGLTPPTVSKVFNELCEVALEVVGSDDELKIRGFGKLSTRKRKSRNHRNPHTGEVKMVQGIIVPVLKFGSEIKLASELGY
jgi:DNA-binding protein HU-beta